MTVPYGRIRARVDVRDVPCQICGTVTVQPVIDHCHVHGWTRGVLCVRCNGVMARVDADLSIAHARELFYRDNCPDCRRDGFAGVSRRLAAPVSPVARAAKRVARRGGKTKRLRATLPDLETACRTHASTVGATPESLTRGQIKEAARASGYSVSSDRVTHLAALLRGAQTPPAGP